MIEPDTRPPTAPRTPGSTWRWAAVLVAAACLYLVVHAIPRLSDGAISVRHAHHAMHDESLILERVWDMIDRRDIGYRIAVYPGLYPYTVAGVRLALGPSSPAGPAIVATRTLSLVAMLLAIVATFVLFGRLADRPWAGAVAASFLAIHPESVLWASRVHPDALVLLFTQVAIACVGLHVKSGREALLRWASVAAGLSAATKLVGCFVMPVIAAWVVWSSRRDARVMLQRLVVHAGLFAGVFVATNPLLFRSPGRLLAGFFYQQSAMSKEGSQIGAWLEVFTGASGLGYAGLALVLVGLAVSIWRRRIDLAVVASFALFYLSFVIGTVSLAMPRYAAPAIWALVALGAIVVVPRSFTAGWRWAFSGVALVVFAAIDLPRQRHELANYAAHYAASFTSEKAALGERLLRVPDVRRKSVVSSSYAYVPEGIFWRYIWSFEDIELPGDDVAAVIVDQTLALDGPHYRALTSGRAGWVKAESYGEFDLYLPTPSTP